MTRDIRILVEDYDGNLDGAGCVLALILAGLTIGLIIEAWNYFQ